MKVTKNKSVLMFKSESGQLEKLDLESPPEGGFVSPRERNEYLERLMERTGGLEFSISYGHDSGNIGDVEVLRGFRIEGIEMDGTIHAVWEESVWMTPEEAEAL